MDSVTIDELYMEYNTSYFCPRARNRIRKRLASAGKLDYRSFTPLEITQEKFEQEAHILNKTVIVDDGTERKVYSSCVFENLKRYDCHVCVFAVFGKSGLIKHNSSKKHFYMMKRSSHPHQNFDETQIVGLEPSVKQFSMSDTSIKTELVDQLKTEVLIGLEYLVEVALPYNPYHHCLLCDKASEDIFNTMNHLQSVAHRMSYLLLFFPKVYKKLILLKRDVRMQELDKVVYKIEKTFGRLKPWRHEGALSLKQKRAIRLSIDSGPHWRDSMDLSFAEDIPFSEKFKNNGIYNMVITELVVDETEEGVIDNYIRLKGGVFRCRLCKINLETPIEKITHPYTGRHLEKTVKGIAIYDSVDCQIQCVFDSFPQPLIGTEYIVEYDEQGTCQYYCMLCRKGMNNTDMVTAHLISKAHRQRYIHHHMPKRNEELLKQSGPVRAEEIEKLIKLVEAKLGRLPPFGCLFSLNQRVDSKRTVKDLVSEKIMDGKHFTLDELGMPKLTYKMPVPLFPKEGQLSEATSQQPKPSKTSKKKKASKRSESPSSPQLSKRRRSTHSSSSGSLSPAARLRGLSPQPGPSRACLSVSLPQETVMPPKAVESWLREIPTPGPSYPHQPPLMTEESIKAFFAECDEDSWKSRIKDESHDCCPKLDVSDNYKEAISNEDIYDSLRLKITVAFLQEKLISEMGWVWEDFKLSNKKLETMINIIANGHVCRDVCRPLCVNLVESFMQAILEEFEEAKTLNKEELCVCARGLVNVSNIMHFMSSHFPKRN